MPPAKEFKLTKSKSAASLKPSGYMKILAQIAAVNGFVRSEGEDADGNKVEAQTTSYPREERVELEDGSDPFDVFFSWIWRQNGT